MADPTTMSDAEYQQYLQQQSGVNPVAQIAPQVAAAVSPQAPAPSQPTPSPVAPPTSNLGQAMGDVTKAATQGQNQLAASTPFPEAKSPNEDFAKNALPYAAGAAGSLAAIYGGKKAIEAIAAPSDETESHEDFMKRMDREERQHEIRKKAAEADMAEMKAKGTAPAAPAAPAAPEVPTEQISEKEALARQIEKVNPAAAQAFREGRVTIAENKAAEQQTKPIESKQGIAPEQPKDHAPIQATQAPAEAPTTANEAGTSAVENHNLAQIKNQAPPIKGKEKKAAVPPQPLETAPQLTTGSGMPAYQGTGEPGVRKKEMSGLHELGSDMAFVPEGQYMDIMRNAVTQPTYTQKLKETGGYPETTTEAYERSRQINSSLGRLPQEQAKEAGQLLENTPAITKRVGGSKLVRVGGLGGAIVAMSDVAKAETPNERSQVIGENAMGMLPPAAQALLYTKEATSPEELAFEAKNNKESAEALRKRQEAAPRLYPPTGSVPPRK
jgi:hypothetical protein